MSPNRSESESNPETENQFLINDLVELAQISQETAMMIAHSLSQPKDFQALIDRLSSSRRVQQNPHNDRQAEIEELRDYIGIGQKYNNVPNWLR